MSRILKKLRTVYPFLKLVDCDGCQGNEDLGMTLKNVPNIQPAKKLNSITLIDEFRVPYMMIDFS
ncbi:hypothetical protein C7B65_26085 [Phormidesmis priestleyi ULC007]|uniref:Uncharacterized protein n=1 Tax=Phormidesmis priestleyi ULC007 TaxID=1920490 RepID=A0A2T1D2H6_9CYAN|nr:hypothetical protein C7B65_26085 [Phormidesmis priestleyi ULC007]